MKRFLLPLIPLALLAATPVQAADLLPPTYQVGKEYIFEASQKMQMDLSGMGAGEPGTMSNTNMDMQMKARCEAGPEADQKTVTITIESMKMNMDMMGMTMAYDSSDPASANTMLGQQMGGVVGKEQTLVFGPNNEIVDFQGIEGMQGAFDMEQMKQMADPASQLGIPPEGVSVGQKWDHQVEMPLGALGQIDLDYKVEYTRDEQVDGKNAAVVAYSGGLEGNITPEGNEEGPVSMKTSQLSGTMVMDKDLRFPISGDNTTSMSISVPNPANPAETVSAPINMQQIFKLISVTDI